MHAKVALNREGQALNPEEIKYVVALIMGWIERQLWGFQKFRIRNHKRYQKKGGACLHLRQLTPPLLYSLLQPLEEHAGRLLKRDNFGLMFAFETLNKSSWFPSQPKDELLNLKAVQSLFNSIELFWRGEIVSTVRLCVKLSDKIFFIFLNKREF